MVRLQIILLPCQNTNKDMKKYIYILGLMLTGLFMSCQDNFLDEPQLTPEQQSLIGKAVNFNVSIADQFITRADYTSYDDGSFNRNDRMRIYRNYWDKDKNDWSDKIAYRSYYFKHKYGAGSINLGTDWLPEAGRKGYDKNAEGKYEVFTQGENDSLTWDNGTTLRFRAWSQSNFHNVLYGSSQTYFYPDFSVAEWVNASGPTVGIPLVLKHLGSRLCFKSKESGNEFSGRIEICAGIKYDGTDNPDGWKDYMYADNADITDSDNSATEAGKPEETAKAECDAVTAVYKRMCMPAGVDMTTGQLMAVKNASWNGLTDAQVRSLEDQNQNIFIKYNSIDASQIASTAKRPFFCGINGSQYMITIPYDISTTGKGEALTLPACTRFRVYMHDTNNGDGFNTSGYEGKYHIFALSDVKKIEKDSEDQDIEVQAFPNGLKMEAGISYTFKVGYRYGALYVVVNDDLSWTDDDLGEVNGTDESEYKPVADQYEWWESAIHKAIPTGTGDFNPVFYIEDERQFLEFIKLVNGTAPGKTDGLYRLVKTYKETQVGGQTIIEPDTYGWSTKNSQYNPEWIEEEEAKLQGYIFYDHYIAANADRAAHSEREYLKGPYPFYNDDLRRNFKVVLKKDLDLKDWNLESIGNTAETPFMGNFDGYFEGEVHTIKNVNMNDGYLFGYINGKATNGASVTNLKIESVHNTALLNVGVNPIYIAGISLHAPSEGNSIATSLSMAAGVTGTSYVVGCIHVGDAGGPLVGTASDLNMYGCMQAAHGLGTGGALIGTDNNNPKVFKPQVSINAQKAGTATGKPSFRNFMCNYYDVTLSPSAHAVGNTSDDYSLLEYIRGSSTDILRAKNDLILEDVPMKTILSKSDYKIYYGLAPWRAMNYAIYWYNKNRGEKHPCNVHFEANSVGYNHRYPVLLPLSPSAKYGEDLVKNWNPIEQPN